MPHSKLHLQVAKLAFSGALFVFLLAPVAIAYADTGTTNPASSGTTNPANPGTTNPADPGTTNPSSGQTIANPLKVASLNDLLNIILKAIVQLGAVILTIALIWTGFKFVAARGNPEKIQSAKTALLWTVIGGLILLGATAIQTVIQSTVSAL